MKTRLTSLLLFLLLLLPSAPAANVTVHGLTTLADPAGADEFEVWDVSAAASRKLTFSALSTFLGAGSGTVTTLSVATANGVSGTVANATTTPAITISLGDITPGSVVSALVEGTSWLRMPWGSAAFPGLAFSSGGDTNTGIYRVSEDHLGFSTGGVKRGEFHSGGLALNGGALTVGNTTIAATYIEADSYGSPGFAITLGASGQIKSMAFQPVAFNDSAGGLVTSAQTLSSAQQAQARANIGAVALKVCAADVTRLTAAGAEAIDATLQKTVVSGEKYKATFLISMSDIASGGNPSLSIRLPAGSAGLAEFIASIDGGATYTSAIFAAPDTLQITDGTVSTMAGTSVLIRYTVSFTAAADGTVAAWWGASATAGSSATMSANSSLEVSTQ